MRAIDRPWPSAPATVSTALSTESNAQTPATMASGWGCSRTSSSLKMPRVPSDPTAIASRSRPMADFGAWEPICATAPSAMTQRAALTLAAIVP